MNLLFWKSNKKHDEFALALASEFIKKFPNDSTHSVPNKRNKLKLNKVLVGVFSKAKKYSEDVKPGFYSRARIGNKFMWSLKDEGYNEQFIEEITRDLLNTISTTNKPVK